MICCFCCNEGIKLFLFSGREIQDCINVFSSADVGFNSTVLFFGGTAADGAPLSGFTVAPFVGFSETAAVAVEGMLADCTVGTSFELPFWDDTSILPVASEADLGCPNSFCDVSLFCDVFDERRLFLDENDLAYIFSLASSHRGLFGVRSSTSSFFFSSFFFSAGSGGGRIKSLPTLIFTFTSVPVDDNVAIIAAPSPKDGALRLAGCFDETFFFFSFFGNSPASRRRRSSLNASKS
mmetsp:Transcript_26533/g.37885  ORF Transcript_26533/g.37885 Transcript_26533/m.37885 type:complete len:237 (-) Transcript_26533:2-712(-)